VIDWKWKPFGDLSAVDLHDILKLRQDVFVIEQHCIYPDIDGADPRCWHLLGRDRSGELAAYLRVVPPGQKYKEPAIGRVVANPDKRRNGLGKELMQVGIRCTQFQYPDSGIRISAQQYLTHFYTGLGFEQVGEMYLEDDIPHIEMVMPAKHHPQGRVTD